MAQVPVPPPPPAPPAPQPQQAQQPQPQAANLEVNMIFFRCLVCITSAVSLYLVLCFALLVYYFLVWASGPLRCVFGFAELVVRENCFCLGLSGRARILNWVQVPIRCVWRLPNTAFGKNCFCLGLSGRAPILNQVQVPIRCVWRLPNSLFGEIFGPFWPGTHTELGSGAN